MLRYGFQNYPADAKTNAALASIFTDLRAWVVQDLCMTREHLRRMDREGRGTVDNIAEEPARQKLYGWILQREYLNQMEYMRDTLTAVIAGYNKWSEEQTNGQKSLVQSEWGSPWYAINIKGSIYIYFECLHFLSFSGSLYSQLTQFLFPSPFFKTNWLHWIASVSHRRAHIHENVLNCQIISIWIISL